MLPDHRVVAIEEIRHLDRRQPDCLPSYLHVDLGAVIWNDEDGLLFDRNEVLGHASIIACGAYPRCRCLAVDRTPYRPMRKRDHPFTDGNKRIGSLLFVHFLDKNGCLSRPDGSHRFDANGLVAIALLVAESDPKQKDMVVRLIMAMLS
jgi:hypothetical protein